MSARRGFTLVELMIAMALFSIIALGLIDTVGLFGRTQRSTTAIDVAQAAVRAGQELISRDCEMASAGARTGTIYMANGGTPTYLAVRVTDSTVGPDQLDLILADTSARANLVAPYASGNTTISVDNVNNFAVNQLIEISDLSQAVIVQVTGVGVGQLNIVANGNALPKTFAAGSWVFKSRQVTYYVDPTPFGAQDPLLMMDPDGPGPLPGQPMAEGVEDFQVALGFDNNNDGIISSVGAVAGDDEWIYNVGGEVAPLTLQNLKVVRITLVARTVQAGSGIYGARPGAEDHPGAAVADQFARRVLRNEATVRNFNL